VDSGPCQICWIQNRSSGSWVKWLTSPASSVLNSVVRLKRLEAEQQPCNQSAQAGNEQEEPHLR